MISLRDIQPTGIFKNPEHGFCELVENILIRTFFEPYIKDRIGWIGVSYRSGQKRGWTFKVKKQKGVFALTYLGYEKNRSYLTGIFNLQYFPDISETVLDFFSVSENILRLEKDFMFWVRRQPSDVDPLEFAFTVGKILITTESDEDALFLSLLAPVRWKTVVRDGFFIIEKDGSAKQVLQPGSLDRNVPSFKLGWKFFDKFILTFCYHLKDGPGYLFLKKRTSYCPEISEKNDVFPSKKNKVQEYMLTVGFSNEMKENKTKPHLNFIKSYFPEMDFYRLAGSKRVIWAMSGLQSHKINPLWWEIKRWSSLKDSSEIPPHLMGIRPSLHIFTGFLGSGKTTIINRIAEYFSLQRNRFVAIIQNEIGSVDIDGSLIDGALSITTLNDGCVCCSLKGELRGAVRDICIKYNPDIIIIETTGIADPATVMKEIPELSFFVRFDSLITVVDGKNLKNILKKYPVAKSQIAHASLIILNKMDLLSDKEIKAAMDILKKLNSHALILRNSHGEINPSILISFDEDIDKLQLERGSKHHLDEKSDASHHMKLFDIANIKLNGVFHKKGFLDFLNQLPGTVYRIKGVIRLDGYKEPLLLQYVAGRYELSEFHDASIEPNSIVFIGQGIDRENLEKKLSQMIIFREKN